MPDTTDATPAADTAPERPQPTLEELQSVLDEIGLTPGQIKGRLEASRKWEDRAKEKEPFIEDLKKKAARLDEIEEANKSELQKLQDRLAAAEGAAATAEAARLRASIAAKHGVPEALLAGADEDALEQSALALLEFRGAAPKAPTSEGQGKVGEPVGKGSKPTLGDALRALATGSD